MKILRPALAGVASAIGTHYADEYMSATPYDQKVYYGAAASGVLGAFLMRKKSPLVAGALLGIAAGSAFQGYTRTQQKNATPGYVPPPQQYPTYQQPYAAPKPATQPYPSSLPSGGGGLPISSGDLKNIYGQAQDYAKKAEDMFGPSFGESVPYSPEDFAADTEAFNADW